MNEGPHKLKAEFEGYRLPHEEEQIRVDNPKGKYTVIFDPVGPRAIIVGGGRLPALPRKGEQKELLSLVESYFVRRLTEWQEI